ncbi:MAG: hypothetical protein KGJ57_09815 [Sphingomonadales bacterium]|nr:hypothetical protein [Sphingomonadales bacterium]MDE2169707.1 hypothetical protein [Sphingomonadales bacterium]
MRGGVRLVTVLGLVALVPAAVGAAPAHDGDKLTLAVCDGLGGARTISVPLGHQDIPGAEQPGCCAKGCQTGTRKKGRRGRFDPAQ